MWPNGPGEDKDKVAASLEMGDLTEEFMHGLSFVANNHDYDIRSTRKTNDGWLEIVFEENDVTEEKGELEVDVRMCKEEFQGRHLLEVRVFEWLHEPATDPKPRTFFISPIPYVLWGAVYCET